MGTVARYPAPANIFLMVLAEERTSHEMVEDLQGEREAYLLAIHPQHPPFFRKTCSERLDGVQRASCAVAMRNM